VTTYAKGLSALIFKKYPYGNVYKNEIKRTPGTIIVRGQEGKNQLIINLFGQFTPGKPKKTGQDSQEGRAKSFQQALNQILALKNLKSLAFPYRIGCGLGGGIWSEYEKMLNAFAAKLPSDVLIRIYRLPGEK